MGGALSLLSLEAGVLSGTDHVNLVLGVTSTLHLQAVSSIGIGSILMCFAGITTHLA